MMIIDEKGRLFGKVSIVDIAIILFVIVVAAVLVWRVVGMDEETVKVQEVTCRYECVVDGIRIESVTALKNEIGNDVFDSQNKKIGTLLSVEEKPYESEMVIESGEVVLKEVPEKYSANIVIEGNCKKANSGYVSGSGYEISVGSKPFFSLGTIDVEAQILNIAEKE